MACPLFTLVMILMLGAWSVPAWGNSVSSANSGDDVENGNIVMRGKHATFTFAASGTTISRGLTAYDLGSIDHGGTKTCTFTWSANSGCSIKVTKIEFGVRGYTSNIGKTGEMQATFNGETKSIGSIVTTLTPFSATNNNGFSSGIALTLKNTCSGHTSLTWQGWKLVTTTDYDSYNYYLNDISITYTITPNAPTAAQTTQTIYVTLNSGSVQNDEKIQLNTSTFFTMPGNDGHFYNYLDYTISAATGSDASKASVSSNYFSATKVGTYYVKANIKQDADDVCHKASGTSTNANTINVVRHPSALSMNDGEVFVKVNSAAASQKDLDDLIGSYTGNGGVTYKVISDNKAHATIGTGNIFSATVCGDYTIEATKAQTDLYAQKKDTFKVTVKKITPAITTNPTASAVVYQQTLATSNITGGAVTWNGYTVTGSFSWVDNTIAPSTGNTYAVQFTPSGDDAARFVKPDNINIAVPIIPIDQTITWDLLDGQNARGQWYEYATGETFDATATSGLTVTYAVTENPSAAHIENGNQLSVDHVGEKITVTATCEDAAGNWNTATATKTFYTCGAKPNDWSEVEASELTYGDLLEVSTLSGDVKLNGVVVPGTLAWENPSTLPSATQNNTPESFSVRFTPENENAYGSVVFEVPVTVKKAKADLNWNISHGLRENTVYSNFVTSTNTDPSASLNISVSSSKLSVEGNKLTTEGVESATNCTIYVAQAATDNYEAIAQVAWPVTIRPKVNVCLPVTMDGDLMGDMTVASTDASWCNTNSQGTDHYLTSDVRYSQEVGIALGSWKDGFTGINWTKLRNLLFGDGTFEWSTKSVDLSFTGVPDRISFSTQLQHVEFLWLGDWKTAKVTADQFILYQSADGSNYTQVQAKQGATTFDEALNPTTRYIRIEYKGNFTGFIKNLQITQKKYLTADKSSLTFADDAERPLQDPQELTISYSSLGSCDVQSGAITVSPTNPAFYVDTTVIRDNVGIDQYGTFTVRVRCNDVNQSGKIVFEAYDGTKLEVPVSSAKPVISAASPVIFKTGTEHAPAAETLYRTLAGIEYTGCFGGAEAKFDTLYIYGVSESAASSRAWELDASKGYNVPVVAAGNLHTPCFVYSKSGSQYEYVRTFDAATTSLDIQAVGKKLGFIGYKPAGTAAFNAIQLNGAANEQTEVYLNNAEIGVNGSALVVNNTEAAEDAFAVKVYARGTNTLQANAAAVQLSANKAQLTVEDSWEAGDASALLALRPGTGKPSIDLGSAKGKVIVNGTKLELHNATNMAIAHIDGTTEMTDGEVKINDGTILGDAILGLPHKTIIDGGTFNAGDIKVYNANGKVVRALNSRNQVLGRQTTTVAQLPDWYGKSHLTLDGTVVHPMLFGGEDLCIFDNRANDNQSATNANWTETPTNGSDAIITRDMEITGSLEVKSLTINPDVTVIVKENATLSVGDGDSYIENAGNLHVENGGKVVLKDGELRVNDFILEASIGDMSRSASSGQVNGEETNLKVRGDSYFQICFDPVAISYGWYDFVLPFDVDVVGGIYLASDLNTPLVNNVDFAIMEFSEAKRAQNTKPWTWFSGTLKAGKLYTITFDETQPSRTTYVFKKKANAEIGAANTYNTICTTSAPATDRGWNGMGNGTLRYCQLNSDELPENAKMQIYDHTNDCYIPCEATQYTYAIGTAFFIQVQENNQTITLDTVSDSRAFRAPSRDIRTVDEFRLALTAENATYAADHLWVSASEEATGEYVIGSDLLKMGTPTSAKVAQMWTFNNGLNLCDIEMPLVGNNASTPLNLYAPQAGTYEIAVEKSPEDATLYLTQNGDIVWNLSMSPYTIDLTKGTTSGYGLRIVADRQTTTDVENSESENQSVRKVLIDDKIYIVTPDGRMYNVQGARL